MQDNQTVPIAVMLRAVASWLESHQEIEAHSIDLPAVAGEVVAVKSYEHESVFEAGLLIQSLGLEPRIVMTGEDFEPLFKVSAEIAPGIRLDLIGPA